MSRLPRGERGAILGRMSSTSNAEAFKTLLRTVEPEKPLADLRLYVEGPRSVATALDARLANVGVCPKKYLLLGARGGGKSTELRKLEALLRARGGLGIVTIDLDATGVTAASVSAFDLLYMCGIALLRRVEGKAQTQLFERLRAAYGGEVDKTSLGKLADALEGLKGFGAALGGVAGSTAGAPGAGAAATAGVMDIVARGIRLLPRRDFFISESSPQGQRLLKLCGEIAAAAQREDEALCVMVDGLEKMNGEANDRFRAVFEQTRLIAEVPWTMVIAAPPSTLTTGDSVGNLGYNTFVVWGLVGEAALLKEAVLQRLRGVGLPDDVIDDAALALMAEMSGGMPRSLMQILVESLWIAVEENHERLTLDVVRRGVREVGLDLARGLDMPDIETLETVNEKGRLPGRKASASLFAAGKILAMPPEGDALFYRYRVHPILAGEL